MPFKLTQVIEDSEFTEVVQAEWESFEDPYCHLLPLFFPCKPWNDTGPDARAKGMEEGRERQIQWNREDPTSEWIKVTDIETGKIAGAALWHVYEGNPCAKESHDKISWWAEGEDREMAELLFGQFLTPRTTYMGKSHVFLDICFVRPEFRRRGVGKLLMDWGIQKADERGLEAYIDATNLGMELYKTYGFMPAEKVDFDPSKPNPSRRWKELEKVLLPFSFWPMWRPAIGKSESRPPWAA